MARFKRPNFGRQFKMNKVAQRLHLLFMIIVLLFVILLFRLAYMQVVNQEFYTEKLTTSTVYKVRNATPRGEIYDATGSLLVANEAKEVVAFTRSNTITAQEIKEIATALSKLVTLTETEVTTREKKDYYLADTSTYRKVVESLPDDKKYDNFGNTLSEATIYKNAVDAVSKDDINYSEDELKIIAIFSQMNAAQAFNTVSLTTGELNDQQIAVITAKSKELSGISVRTDWTRKAASNSLSSVIGTVSSEKTGLPAEEVDTYLKKGYSLNDRVGTSYLEKQYEDVLQGNPTLQEITLDKDGSVKETKEVSKGTKGQNLKLTIDLKFQEGVEEILEKYFKQELENGGTVYSEGIYATALDPNTGAVLALGGISHDLETGELSKNSLGNITQVFTPGSVVKGATLAAGWENGVLSGNETLYDQSIVFSGDSNTINSWFTSGSLPITATQALEYSSNPYMVQIALRLMGMEYHTGLSLATDQYKEAMEKLRATYAQFGLGVKTGIDLPGESVGILPTEFVAGNVLTESFGQYDNYTTLQLAQYVATIANGGTRIAPHIVDGIYTPNKEDGIGDLSQTVEGQKLGTVNISSEEMSLIQQGFYQVANGSGSYTTGTKIGNGAAVSISAKTGTAEAYVKTADGNSIYTSNLNAVAYAPSDQPKIAVAVVLPHETELRGDVSEYVIRDIINLYHSMYPMN